MMKLPFLTLKGGKAIRGMLADLINEKANAYVEPKRRGTRRGQPIGLSQKKYLATLLDLTNIPLKQQAKGIKVSYGLLRKWRTEKQFYMSIGEHHQELSKRFWDFVKEYMRKDKKVMEKHYLLPLREFATAEIRDYPLPEGIFDDRGIYNPTMGPEMNPFSKPLSELSDDEILVAVEGHRIMRYLGWLGRDEKRAKERAKKRIPSLIAAVKDVLAKDNPTVEDRRHGILLLRLLENNLTELEAEPNKSNAK